MAWRSWSTFLNFYNFCYSDESAGLVHPILMNSDSFDSSLAESYGFGHDDKHDEPPISAAEKTRGELTNMLQKDLEDSGNKESILFKNGNSKAEDRILNENSPKKVSANNECSNKILNENLIKIEENKLSSSTSKRLVKKYYINFFHVYNNFHIYV